MNAQSNAESFEVADDFAFLGRTFAEYRRMFGLDVDAITGRRILDCPGGSGAFTATASEFAESVTAVDPVYGPPAAELEALCRRSVAENVEQLEEKADLFVWDHYRDPETRGRFQRAAAERFLADYAQHPGRYVAGSLPSLPFPDDTFDLTLSGNFLFLYDDRLSRAFHEAALAELLRVTAEAVRFFPLAALDRQRSTLLEPMVGWLSERGHDVRFETVPYEFQPDVTETMVVQPA